MAVKRDGEKYLGAELRVPLSEDGQVAAYVWPVRIVVIRGLACGGPTIGVDVGNQEIEQCIRRLRRRIEPDPSNPQYVITVRGYGFKMP